MYKVIASDVDGVIKPFYDPVPAETSEILRKLAEKFHIVLLSGRQAYYLDGLICGMGLPPEKVSIVAEEGAVVFYPDIFKHVITLEKDILEEFNSHKKMLIDGLIDKFGEGILVVPTFVIGTLVAGELFDEVVSYLEEKISENDLSEKINLVFHKQHFVIQIKPKEIDKLKALEIILKERGFKLSEVIGIGDGLNDLPILYNVGFSIGIGDVWEIRMASKVRFKKGVEAFRYLEKLYL